MSDAYEIGKQVDEHWRKTHLLKWIAFIDRVVKRWGELHPDTILTHICLPIGIRVYNDDLLSIDNTTTFADRVEFTFEGISGDTYKASYCIPEYLEQTRLRE